MATPTQMISQNASRDAFHARFGNVNFERKTLRQRRNNNVKPKQRSRDPRAPWAEFFAVLLLACSRHVDGGLLIFESPVPVQGPPGRLITVQRLPDGSQGPFEVVMRGKGMSSLPQESKQRHPRGDPATRIGFTRLTSSAASLETFKLNQPPAGLTCA
jgi:hypothetical protein